MSVQTQPAFLCFQCNFINYMVAHCPRCDSYILTPILILEPVGFEESQKHNEFIKTTDGLHSKPL